ncbi:hypothetical protein KC19_VG248900, partial [Ceratodon purpureus]
VGLCEYSLSSQTETYTSISRSDVEWGSSGGNVGLDSPTARSSLPSVLESVCTAVVSVFSFESFGVSHSSLSLPTATNLAPCGNPADASKDRGQLSTSSLGL